MKSKHEGLDSLVDRLREDLEEPVRKDTAKEKPKKCILLFAHNGTGKTRLSMAFKDVGKKSKPRDTLYFNAFTEDLFVWNNDLKEDKHRALDLRRTSQFFCHLDSALQKRIAELLLRYVDFAFNLNDDPSKELLPVTFSRPGVKLGEPGGNIKISRGEESVFTWCFYFAIAERIVKEKGEMTGHKYIFIDDPISSLDEENAVSVALDVAQLITGLPTGMKAVVSTHHLLFFNVLCNALKERASSYFLSRAPGTEAYELEPCNSMPFLYHLIVLRDLHRAKDTDEIFPHHFAMLRRLMEQTACFLGHKDWGDLIECTGDAREKVRVRRLLNVKTHGGHTPFEVGKLEDRERKIFGEVFDAFVKRCNFGPKVSNSGGGDS